MKRLSLVSPFHSLYCPHNHTEACTYICVTDLISHSANVDGLLEVRPWSRHLGSARADKDSLVELTCEGRDRQ